MNDKTDLRKYAEAHGMNRGCFDHINKKFIAEFTKALKGYVDLFT